jgi:phosphoglycolate phosphatase-like HAD superfamily hydrolase
LTAIIFDLDGTLADISHRVHFVQRKKKDWISFFREIPKDKPIVALIDLAQLLIASQRTVLFATGRPEITRTDSIEWLIKNGINTDFDTCLLMRKDGDRRSDALVKKDIFSEIKAEGFNPYLIFDDRQTVVDMWRSLGLRVAQVAPGDF